MIILLFLTSLQACGAGKIYEDYPMKGWENDQELLETHKKNLLHTLRNSNYASMQLDELATFACGVKDDIGKTLEKHHDGLPYDGLPYLQIIADQEYILKKKEGGANLETFLFYFDALCYSHCLSSLVQDRNVVCELFLRHGYRRAYRNVLSSLEDFCANSELWDGVDKLQEDLDEIKKISGYSELQSLNQNPSVQRMQPIQRDRAEAIRTQIQELEELMDGGDQIDCDIIRKQIQQREAIREQIQKREAIREQIQQREAIREQIQQREAIREQIQQREAIRKLSVQHVEALMDDIHLT